MHVLVKQFPNMNPMECWQENPHFGIFDECNFIHGKIVFFMCIVSKSIG